MPSVADKILFYPVAQSGRLSLEENLCLVNLLRSSWFYVQILRNIVLKMKC